MSAFQARFVMTKNLDTMRTHRAAILTLWYIGMKILNWVAGAAGANELFAKNCASCHGKDGKAQTSVDKKLGAKYLGQSQLPDAQIEQQILEGRPAQQNTAKMPALKDRLTGAEIKSLIPIVKGLRPQPKQESDSTAQPVVLSGCCGVNVMEPAVAADYNARAKKNPHFKRDCLDHE